MHLHASTVQLPLHAGRAGEGQRIGHRGGGAGQHRLHTHAGGEPDLQRLPRQRPLGGGAQIPEQHGRPPQRGPGYAGGLRHGIGHHALVGALAQFAAHHPHQMPLLCLGQPRQQPGQQLVTTPLGPGAGGTRQIGQHPVHLGHGDRGCLGGRSPHVAQGGPADTQPTLTGLAHQQPHHRRRQPGRHPAQQVGQAGHLGRTGSGARHLIRGRDHVLVLQRPSPPQARRSRRRWPATAPATRTAPPAWPGGWRGRRQQTPDRSRAHSACRTRWGRPAGAQR